MVREEEEQLQPRAQDALLIGGQERTYLDLAILSGAKVDAGGWVGGWGCGSGAWAVAKGISWSGERWGFLSAVAGGVYLKVASATE